MAAALLRLVCPRPPRCLEHRLGNAYAYVPEMALHKAIELRAFLTVEGSYRGRGVDLGCGDGVVGGILVQEGGLEGLHGVDFYAEIGQQCLQRGYAGFSAGDVQALPLSDATFDYAISVCVIEHVPDQDRVVAEVARVLKPGGQFHFTTPSPNYRTSTLGYRFLRALGLRSSAAAFQEYKDVESMHFHYHKAEEWRAKLEAAGFLQVRITPIFSRGRVLAYDLMNCQVLFLRFFFADKLSEFFGKHERWKRLVAWATAEVASALGSPDATPESGSHFFISCTRSS